MQSKTLRGLIWSFTELISKQGIQLLVLILLARILLPEHFGLIGMVTIFISISTTLVQSGLDQALIRERDPKSEDFSTIFTFNLITSTLIYLIVFFTAPIVAGFFNEQRLVLILRVLMIIVIINAFSIIQRVLLIRSIDFKTQTKVSLIATSVAGATSIMLALFGAGVWSLVIQQIIMNFAEMVLLIKKSNFIPKISFNWNIFKRYFKFGYRLLLSGLIDTIYNNIFFVIIGRMYSVVQLGYYTNANKLKDVASKSVTTAIQKVTYPVLSTMQDDNNKLSRNYQQLIKMTSYIFFPFMLGIASIAPTFIPLVLGPNWSGAIVYFQLLCFAGMLYPIHAINLNILKVKNRSDLFLRLEIIKKVIFTILILCAINLSYGVEGLIYSLIINSVVSLLINTYYSAKLINYSFVNQIKDMLPSFLLSIIMIITVHYSIVFIEVSILLELIIQITVGFIVYLGLSLILNLKEFKLILRFIKSILKK